MRIENYKNTNDTEILKGDIMKLRDAYENNNISSNYLAEDIKSIMNQEGIDKFQAIDRILRIIGN